MKRKFRHFFPVLFILVSACLTAQTNIFEKDIQAFEKMDSIQMPAPGGIVFIGSSSIRGWRSLPQDYPELNVINRGFGGSEFKDAVHYFERIVAKYQPKQVVIYEGDNDIASGKSPEEVYKTFLLFVEKMREQLPNTELVVLAVKPSLSRWDFFPAMQSINKKMKCLAKKDEQVVFIDVATPMLNEKGEPKPELFLGDGIHMTPQGYELWASIVEPFLRN